MKKMKIILILLVLSSFSFAQKSVAIGVDVNNPNINVKHMFKKFYGMASIGGIDVQNYSIGAGIKIGRFDISSMYTLGLANRDGTSTMYHDVDTRLKVDIGSFMGCNPYFITGLNTDFNLKHLGVGSHRNFGKHFYTDVAVMFNLLENAPMAGIMGKTDFIINVGYKL